MNKLLYSQSTQQRYGFNRLNNEDPAELDPDILVLTRVEADPPEITENQSLTFTYVVDVDSLEDRQVWTVTNNPPAPNWDGFNEAILSNVEFNMTTGAVLQLAPSLALALPAALSQVATNGVTAFGLVFNPFCTVGQVSSEQRGIWADLAVTYNLPGDFVGVVRGS